MSDETIIMLGIDEVRPYENNPRTHDDISEITESIRRVGFRGSIWVDADHVIIAGHGRYLAAKALGMKEIPVTVMDDLSEAEVKYLRIKDNRASEQSAWDEDAYLKELDDLKGLDFDVDDIDLDVGGVELDMDGLGEDFMLPDGDRPGEGTVSFTLTAEQKEIVDHALEMATGEGYEYGNKNRNGSKITEVCALWLDQKT